MNLDKLEGNSRNKQSVEPRSAVVGGGVKQQKASIGTRVQDELNTQWKDVLLPAAKDMIVDMLRGALDGVIEMGKNAIDMKIYGEIKSHRKSGVRGANTYTRYWGNSSESKKEQHTSTSYENIIFDTRADAVAVLEGMTDILEEYQVVSVADMLELSGLKPNYTDRGYGWFKLGRAEILGTRDGYILSMPRPSVIR